MLLDHLQNTDDFAYPFANVERLTLIRQQRAEAAKKREEEKAGMSLATFTY